MFIIKYLRISSLVLTIANFGAMWIFAAVHGGGAFGGKIENGKYFLVHRKNLIEVGREVFILGKWIEISFLINFVACFAISLIWVNLKMARQDYVADTEWDKNH